ncbi:type I DNA topoisomerase [candidate division GN15 bacterium]|nr:type I DNA topoisomerase [candidate division GN15 bacterium]
MKLIVVESPAKAKTIEKFLGAEYKVAASYGHIRDLPGSASEIPASLRDEKWARLGVNTEEDFKPVYVVPTDSKKRINELKKLMKQADELLLATDEDREGESISWHLIEVLKPKIPVRRIAFHEITRSAIKEAMENPREVDTDLVRAQESRRILDRLYGYSLSPVLWKKVRTKLSAGRVQSVALRLLVEREEERQAFHKAQYWDVEAELQADDMAFTATLTSVDDKRLAIGKDFDPATGQLKKSVKAIQLDEQRATKIATDAPEAVPWHVTRVEKKQTRQRPAPPFTTSTMQQAANNRLNMSARQTMMVAQRLYEGIDLGGGDRQGLITYMRTDSVTLSQKALKDAETFIKKTYGDDYHTGTRQYTTKSKSAQEAHEAIRPTEMGRTPESVAKYLGKDELNLYRLIWNRAVASQMADAILDKVTVDISVELDGSAHVFRANGSTVKFPGFLKVYGNGGKETLLPDLTEGQTIGGESDKVRIVGTKPLGHETSPPARYTEASLVKKLEEEGIGRPSTYAPTISTIQQRDYCFKKSGALVPTYVGMAVVHLLREHFAHYVDLKFTARMEEVLDDIATGDTDAVKFLSEFYHGNGEGEAGLLTEIDKQLPNIEFPAIPVGTDPETNKPIFVRIGKNSVYVQRDNGGEDNTATIPVDLLIDELTSDKALELLKRQAKTREPIGVDPESGKNVYALVGPYGPYVQLGEAEKRKKPKRVGLPPEKRLEEVDLEYALRLLQLPRKVGDDPETGKQVNAGIGPYGPFVERDGLYRSLDSVDEVFSIQLDEALKRLAEKRTVRTKRALKELGPHPETGKTVQVMTGRYGPYVTDGTVNASLKRRAEPTALTMDEAVQLLAEAAARGKTRRGRKSATRKNTTAKKSAKKSTKKSAKKSTKKAAKKTPKKSTGKSTKKSTK